jgi:hypothetical protein
MAKTLMKTMRRTMWIYLLTGVMVVGAGLIAWRLLVGRSQLVVTSDKVHFPTVSGFNLDRQELQFPRDFAGELNLIFIAFLQEQQSVINTWIPYAQEVEYTFPGMVYYELPIIDELPVISRTFINEGMRAGIPDPKARQRTITLYIDLQKFMQATGIPDNSDVHILLVNRAGEILWRATGNFEQVKGDELVKTIENAKRNEP